LKPVASLASNLPFDHFQLEFGNSPRSRQRLASMYSSWRSKTTWARAEGRDGTKHKTALLPAPF
jgi:hypothetical protein